MIEFLLLIISITLLYILLPVIAIFVFCRRILTGDWNYAKVWFYATAKEIDIFGNFIGAPLFNWALIKEGKHDKHIKGTSSPTKRKSKSKKSKHGKTSKHSKTSVKDIIKKCKLCEECIKEINKHIN